MCRLCRFAESPVKFKNAGKIILLFCLLMWPVDLSCSFKTWMFHAYVYEEEATLAPLNVGA